MLTGFLTTASSFIRPWQLGQTTRPSCRRIRDLHGHGMRAAAFEDVAHQREDVGCADKVQLDEEQQVGEIADACVRAVAMLASQGMQLLREVLRRGGDLDLRRREPVKIRERARYLERLGRQQLVAAGCDIETNGGEDLARKLGQHVEAKADVECLWRADLEGEQIRRNVHREKVDQAIPQIGASNRLAASHQIEVARGSRSAAEAPLEDHASLHDPLARLAGIESGHHALEHETAPQAVDFDVLRLGACIQPRVDRLPEARRGFVRQRPERACARTGVGGVEAELLSIIARARSMRSAGRSPA